MTNNPPCRLQIENAFSLSLCVTCEQKVNCVQFTRLFTGKNRSGAVQVHLFPSALSGGWNERRARRMKRPDLSLEG
jgi:hypothetical protein